MRGILIFLLAIGLLFLSTTAEGEDWELLTITVGTDDLWFVDKGSIRYVSKTVVRAWVKQVFKNPTPFNSKNIVEMFIYLDNDCVKSKNSLLRIVHKYSDGTGYSFNMPEIEWTYILPNTNESDIFDYLCKGKK